MKEPTEPRLPGMPGPSLESLQRREAATNALRDLHSALLQVIDNLRGQDKAAFAFEVTIKGDRIKIHITPGKEKI